MKRGSNFGIFFRFVLLLRILDFGSYMPPDAINKADQGQCYISN